MGALFRPQGGVWSCRSAEGCGKPFRRGGVLPRPPFYRDDFIYWERRAEPLPYEWSTGSRSVGADDSVGPNVDGTITCGRTGSSAPTHGSKKFAALFVRADVGIGPYKRTSNRHTHTHHDGRTARCLGMRMVSRISLSVSRRPRSASTPHWRIICRLRSMLLRNSRTSVMM